MIKMTPSEYKRAIIELAAINQPWFAWSDPGVGKSQIAEQASNVLFAAKYGYEPGEFGNWYKPKSAKSETITPGDRRKWLFDFRAILRDPVDFTGVPEVKNGRTYWAVPDLLPKIGSGLLFYDELNRAMLPMQNSCLQIILDRRIGDYNLPKDWVQGAAGNFESEIGVQRMSDAMRSRFVHIYLEASHADWVAYAESMGFHPIVVAFIRWRPELLHKYSKQAVKEENTFPCPRTWEVVSKICKRNAGKVLEHALIDGTVGKSTAGEFIAFAGMYRELPDMDALIRDPRNAPLPTKPATNYAISSALARMANHSNLQNIITYLDRLPEQEYAVLAVKEMVAHKPELDRVGPLTQWKVQHPEVLM